LKYFGDMPTAVKYPGLVHGILFVFYCILLVILANRDKWTNKKAIIGFIASLIPFGPFIFHKNYMD